MKTLLDFVPIALFFAAYKLHAWFGISKDEAIYFATPVLMAATAVQMAIIYRLDRKLSPMHKVTLALVLIFGSVTLIFHDKRFIMWKPSVLYAGMAIALGVSNAFYRRNYLKTMLGSQLELPDHAWQKLNTAWVLYCVFMCLSNAYVATYFSEDAWANFKIWGYIFPLVFLIGQGIYMFPHLRAAELEKNTKENSAPGDFPS